MLILGLADRFPQARFKIIPTGIEREQSRNPKQDQAGFGDPSNNFVAVRACNEKAERNKLQRRLHFGDLGHRKRYLQFGQKFPEARDENFPAKNDERRGQGMACSMFASRYVKAMM